MISLPVGVKVVKFYNSEMKKVGKGILYILSNGIMFEKKGEGAKLECTFDYLASFEAVKKDRLAVVVRTPDGLQSVEFKVDIARQVEFDILQVCKGYSNASGIPQPIESEKKAEFDQDAHSLSEARWFEANWDKIMKFLKPERVSYLNDYVKNARTGSPHVDPYLLVVKFENLTYNDFSDLSGFLKWRYKNITDKEVNMISNVFHDFDMFSVRTLEMQIKRASFSKNYVKEGRSLYEHIAINSKEIEENLNSKNINS